MFTTDVFGKTPGDVETPEVTNTDEGIRFTVTGLSPIAVGWTRIASLDDASMAENTESSSSTGSTGSSKKSGSSSGSSGSSSSSSSDTTATTAAASADSTTAVVGAGTGDETPIQLYGTGFMAAIAGIVMILKRRRYKA
jgi:uncharacterized surface anchored protein